MSLDIPRNPEVLAQDLAGTEETKVEPRPIQGALAAPDTGTPDLATNTERFAVWVID